MQWNYNIAEAKKPIITTTLVKTKKGKVEKEIRHPFYVMVKFVRKTGEVEITKSHWMEDQDRWERFKKDDSTPPLAFIPWEQLTVHPDKERKK